MQKPLTPEQAQEAADAYINHGRNGLQAAQALGLPRSTFDNRLRAAKRLGMLPDELPGPGFEVSSEKVRFDKDGEPIGKSVATRPAREEKYTPTEEFAVAGKKTHVDSRGMVAQQWIHEKPDADRTRALIDAFTDSLKGYKPRKPYKAPKKTDPELHTIFLLPDSHIGAYASAIESGKEYSIDIAKDYILENMAKMVESAPRSHSASLVLLGDTLHADGRKNSTPGSGHQLDIHRRYPDALRAAADIVLTTMDLILAKSAFLTGVVIEGNHDSSASDAMRILCDIAYRNNDRVNVAMNSSHVHAQEFGCNFVCMVHGHMCKLDAVPMLMASRFREEWGRTTHKAAFTGHFHQERVRVIGNVVLHQLPAVTPGDHWSAASGYSSPHGFTAHTMSKTDGPVATNYRTFPSMEESKKVA